MPQQTDFVKIPRAVLESVIGEAKRIESMQADDVTPYDPQKAAVSLASALGTCNGIAFGIVLNLESFAQKDR